MDKGSNISPTYLATKTFIFIKHFLETVFWRTQCKKYWSRIKTWIFASCLYLPPKSENLPLIHDVIFKEVIDNLLYYSGGRGLNDE